MADGPFALVPTPAATRADADASDPYTRGASIMALVHNVVIRGLNSLYRQAPYVAAADAADFVGYALSWIEFAENHVRNEAAAVFPAIEARAGEPGLMDADRGEHAAFAPGLAATRAYLESVASGAGAGAFSGARLVALLDDFAAPLHAHLAAQVPRLAGLARLGPAVPMLDIVAAEGRRAPQTLSKTGGLVFFVRNLDRGFEDGRWKDWPPMPAAARWGLLRTLGRWHAGWWRFASCDESGRLQKLYATG